MSVEIDIHVTEALINFLSEYMEVPPEKINVSSFLEEKMKEREIISSLKQGYITLDEAVSFVLDHTFTKFVKGVNYRDDKRQKLEVASVAVRNFLIQKLASHN